MKISRKLTPREIEFFGKLRQLFIDYNAIICCEEAPNLYVVVDFKVESDLSNTDIGFNHFFDDTDIDELFEKFGILPEK